MSSTAVIFDMDGVIVDNIQYHLKAWQQTCKKHGIELTKDRFDRELNGRTMKDTVNILFNREFSPEELKTFSDEKESLYRDIYREYITPTPGLIEFLSHLKDAGIPMAIATSAPPENVEFTLKLTQTEHFFTDIVDSSMVTQGKPHPEVYLKAAATLQYSPDQCFVFEDAIKGIEAGKASGATVIAITTTHVEEELSFADHVITDFNGLDIDKLQALKNK